MSCLSRIGCLAVAAIGGAGAWWLYGGSVPTWMNPSEHLEGAKRGAPTAVAQKPVTWATLHAPKQAMRSANALAHLESLDRATGPAFVSLNASEVADVLSNSIGTVFPIEENGTQLRIDDDLLRIRTVLPLRALGGKDIPDIVGCVLSDRDTVEIAGSMELLRPGLGQFRARQLNVRGIDIPPRLIPPLVRNLRKGQKTTDSLSSDGIGVPLPRSVADIRVSRGKLTLYKAVPK